MLSGRHTFIAERNAEFNRQVQWLQADGNPHNLSGLEPQLVIRESIGGLEITTFSYGSEIATDPLNGLIQIVVSAADMSEFTFTRAHYFLYVGDTLILSGVFIINWN